MTVLIPLMIQGSLNVQEPVHPDAAEVLIPLMIQGSLNSQPMTVRLRVLVLIPLMIQGSLNTEISRTTTGWVLIPLMIQGSLNYDTLMEHLDGESLNPFDDSGQFE